MTRHLRIQPLTASAFAPFGDVLEAAGTPDKMINEGRCGRYHDRTDRRRRHDSAPALARTGALP